MKTTFDTDTILFQILKASAPLVAAISGGIYSGERPDNSVLEDVVASTLTLTQDVLPQKGVSNVNIHVVDIEVMIAGRSQKKANTVRLKLITGLVLNALRAARVEGLSIVVKGQTEFNDPGISQHYVNLRIEWTIH